METSQRVVDSVFGALASAVPEKIQAASAGTMSNVTFGGINPETNGKFAYYETIAGGMGARDGLDGINAIQTHMTNTLNTPVEALEKELPILINSYSVRQGSGGNGKYKGGNGIVREFQFLTDAEATIITDRRKHSPYGVNGGSKGKKGNNSLVSGNKTKKLPAKKSFKIKPGEILRIETPGGGRLGKTLKTNIMTAYPKLIAVDAFPVEDNGKKMYCVRDPQNSENNPLFVSELALYIMTFFNGSNSLDSIIATIREKYGKGNRLERM